MGGQAVAAPLPTAAKWVFLGAITTIVPCWGPGVGPLALSGRGTGALYLPIWLPFWPLALPPGTNRHPAPPCRHPGSHRTTLPYRSFSTAGTYALGYSGRCGGVQGARQGQRQCRTGSVPDARTTRGWTSAYTGGGMPLLAIIDPFSHAGALRISY